MGVEGRGESNARNCVTMIWWIIKLPFTDFLIRKGNPVINQLAGRVYHCNLLHNPTPSITVSYKFLS